MVVHTTELMISIRKDFFFLFITVAADVVATFFLLVVLTKEALLSLSISR